MSDERRISRSAWAGGPRMRTGQSARMCCSIVWEELVETVSTGAGGKTKFCCTNASSLKCGSRDRAV
jgi:hypothetical protein